MEDVYFHYNFIKNNFDARLLFTDPDSLAYEMKSENVYEEFFKQKDLFDFSNYSKVSKFFVEARWICFRNICWIRVKHAFNEKNRW